MAFVERYKDKEQKLRETLEVIEFLLIELKSKQTSMISNRVICNIANTLEYLITEYVMLSKNNLIGIALQRYLKDLLEQEKEIDQQTENDEGDIFWAIKTKKTKE